MSDEANIAGDESANEGYAISGPLGPGPIADTTSVEGNAAGATYVGAQNDAPDGQAGNAVDGAEGADPLTADEGYDDASKERLEAEIERRGLEVPATGSGANGNVVKADLIEVLEQDDAA